MVISGDNFANLLVDPYIFQPSASLGTNAQASKTRVRIRGWRANGKHDSQLCWVLYSKEWWITI